MIKIENLSKSYGTNQVLSDINLTFEHDKVYGKLLYLSVLQELRNITE